MDAKCAKHGKHIEADAKLKELNAGSRAYVSNFEKIAAEYSEDNAKLGEPSLPFGSTDEVALHTDDGTGLAYQMRLSRDKP